MPRKKRTQPGSSGGAYQNRTDLTQPVSVPTGLPYGERQALEQAQQQAPLPQQAPTPQGLDPAIMAAMAHNFQGSPINAMSDRPHEPITHGLPIGPGAGPEVLPQSKTMTDQMMKLAMSTGDPAIQEIANRMAQFGI